MDFEKEARGLWQSVSNSQSIDESFALIETFGKRAFSAGEESMRERAAEKCKRLGDDFMADAIRALPITGEGSSIGMKD